MTGTVLLCCALDGARFGLSIFDVLDIGPPPAARPIARAPRGVVGLTLALGRIAVLLDMRGLLDRPPAPSAARPAREAVFVEQDGAVYGLIFDAVGASVTVGPVDQRDPAAAPGGSWAVGIAEAAYALEDGPIFAISKSGLLARATPSSVAARAGGLARRGLQCGQILRGA